MTLLKQFEKWHKLNSDLLIAFTSNNNPEIKRCRELQRKIEDELYEIVLKNASEKIRKFLPKDCGEMEIGYEYEDDKEFYFVTEESKSGKLIAIILDKKGQVKLIKNFQIE